MSDQIVVKTASILNDLGFAGAPERLVRGFEKAVYDYMEWRDIQVENAQFQMDHIDDKETP
jgi:hypothetical protein